jgi:subtilisin-like proprotein convertase family protein
MSFRLLVAALCVLPLGSWPARAETFSNLTPFTIPSSGAASLYPSQILVSGVASPVSDVSVTITNLTHDWPLDVDILLVGPEGQNVVLMSDSGGSATATNQTLVFDDAGPALTVGGPLVSGTYRPTNLAGTGSDGFPAPAPSLSGATTLATFDGTNANGLWSLYVQDDDAGAAGSVGAWAITLPEPGAAGQGAAWGAVLALAARTRGVRRR